MVGYSLFKIKQRDKALKPPNSVNIILRANQYGLHHQQDQNRFLDLIARCSKSSLFSTQAIRVRREPWQRGVNDQQVQMASKVDQVNIVILFNMTIFLVCKPGQQNSTGLHVQHNQTRLGHKCQTPFKVKPLPLPVQKTSSSVTLFFSFKDCFH